MSLKSMKQIADNFFKGQRKVRIIRSDLSDIHFNLATEEYIYEKSQLEYPTLFLWRNDKSVIIGRHQNQWKECHIQRMEQDRVKLARRKTGGGSVYHDLGNSCFSFFSPIYTSYSPLDAKAVNNYLLLESLKKFNLEAQLSGRNDMVYKDRKISGSAYQINLGKSNFENRKLLHHGTMLLNLQAKDALNYLNPHKAKLQSKGVDSVVSRIMNLSEVTDIDHQSFSGALAQSFKEFYDCEVMEEYWDEKELTKNDKINKIFEELKSWEWVYQRTPSFTNEIEHRFDWGIFDLQVTVEKGQIKEGIVYSDCLLPHMIDSFNNAISSGKILYDMNGIHNLCSMVKQDHFGDIQINEMVDEIQEFLVKNI